MGPPGKQTKGKPRFGAELGVLAMAFSAVAVTRLVLGALGGLALGSALGIGASVLGPSCWRGRPS